uniref:Uncharacterized protein n=1 Tax=Ficedula albicollis TaxID=59894 RepID=A0A803VEY1_FICAL
KSQPSLLTAVQRGRIPPSHSSSSPNPLPNAEFSNGQPVSELISQLLRAEPYPAARYGSHRATGPNPPQPLQQQPQPPPQRRVLQRAAGVGADLAAAARRALPGGALRLPVRPARQRHGHRQHLRAGRPPALQHRGVGPQHPLLPRAARVGPGGAAAAELERAVRAERGAVGAAAAHGAAAGRRRLPRLAHVGRQGGGLHGPDPRLPGAGGQAQPAAGGLGRVQLPQGHRALHAGRLRAVGHGARGGTFPINPQPFPMNPWDIPYTSRAVPL